MMHKATLAPGTVDAGPVTAVWIDPQLVRFALHPGLKESGGLWATPSSVPTDEQAVLLAAFNSAFKLKDSHGGYVIDGRGAATMVPGAATFWIDADGRLGVGRWGHDVALAATVVAARQNLMLLVDAGVVAPNAGDAGQWGAAVRGPRTWRCGVGVTATGAVLYLCGSALTAADLGSAFVAAGAVRAMELDINYSWVTFRTHDSTSGVAVGTKLVSDMSGPADRYLSPDDRDFVTVVDRNPPTITN